MCKCDCGKEVPVKPAHLNIGKTKSCGCSSAKFWAEKNYKPNFEAAKNRLMRNYKRNALMRNYEFSLSKEEFEKLLTGNCFYCGIEPVGENRPPRAYKYVENVIFKYNGVDRYDNTKGYTVNNCVSCCFTCNRAKLDMSVEQWTAWLQRISKFQTKS